MRETIMRIKHNTSICIALAALLAFATACQNQTPTPNAPGRFSNPGGRGGANGAAHTRDRAGHGRGR